MIAVRSGRGSGRRRRAAALVAAAAAGAALVAAAVAVPLLPGAEPTAVLGRG